MIRINCTVYEKRDFLEILNYAKKKRIEECNADKITPKLLELELKKIEVLIQRVNGKYRDDYFDNSSKVYREKTTQAENTSSSDTDY